MKSKYIKALVGVRAIATALVIATASYPQPLPQKGYTNIRAGKYKRYFIEIWLKQRVKQIWTLGDGSRPNILSTFLATPGQFNRWSGKSFGYIYDVPVGQWSSLLFPMVEIGTKPGTLTHDQ